MVCTGRLFFFFLQNLTWPSSIKTYETQSQPKIETIKKLNCHFQKSKVHLPMHVFVSFLLVVLFCCFKFAYNIQFYSRWVAWSPISIHYNRLYSSAYEHIYFLPLRLLLGLQEKWRTIQNGLGIL